MAERLIQLRLALLRWPLAVSVVVTLCATLLVSIFVRSALHESNEFRAIELARSIDAGALVTHSRGYLQNLVAALSGHGATANVFVVVRGSGRIIAASHPKLLGGSLWTMRDTALRDAIASSLSSGKFSSSVTIAPNRHLALLPLVPKTHQIQFSNSSQAFAWLTPSWHSLQVPAGPKFTDIIFSPIHDTPFMSFDLANRDSFGGAIAVEMQPGWTLGAANATVILIGLLFSLSSAFMLISAWATFRSYVVKPLIKFRSMIERQREGDRAARIAPTGVQDFDVLARPWNDLLDDREIAEENQRNFIAALKNKEQDLIAARLRAEAADRAKSDFIALMSHELRTPLNSVIGFAGMIARDQLGPSGQQRSYREFGQIIETSANTLLSIINTIIELNRLDTGTAGITEEPFGPGNIARRAVAAHAAEIEAQGIAVTVVDRSRGAALLADPRSFRRILDQLLSNAIRFNRPKSPKIKVEITVDRERRLVMTVHDTGIGIPAEVLARVTEPFFQVRSGAARSHDGIGLGLTLTRALAEVHGASFTIESRPGRGTKVKVIFPASRLERPRRSRSRRLRAKVKMVAA